MGIIRKTLSVGTLGIVPFRSKKELLRRAEKDRRAAEAALTKMEAARAEVDRRLAEAQKRVKQAELTALHEAKVAAKAKEKGRRGRRGRRRAERARTAIGDIVGAAQPIVEEQAKAAGRRARKAAKVSQKAAERAQHEARRGGRRARARMHEVEHAMAPHVEAAAERALTFKDDLVERTATAADKLKERAEAARER
jgi:hypothetical protein